MPRDASELLADLRESGLSVSLQNDRIAIRPAGKLTPPILAEVRRLRVEIIELLARKPKPPPLYRDPRRYQPHDPHDPFWSDPTQRDAIEDMEARLGGDPTKGF